jgi:ABC-type antimicrobial peptide transport system permease subunit
MLAGEVIGLVGSQFLTRAFSGVLYGVSPNDFRAFATAVGVLTTIGFVASYIPARRAAKIDPMVALRYE